MRRLVALAAVALLATACSSGDDDAAVDDDGPAVVDADEGIDGVLAVRVTGGHSNDAVDYERHPPAGGVHNPLLVNCGFYDSSFPDELLVHDIEHGAVWLAYSPELPDADVEVLHDIVRDEEKVVAAPYPDLDPGVAVVVTAWARQLILDDARDPRVREFIDRYRDGDHAPESGLACLGSPIGEPLP